MAITFTWNNPNTNDYTPEFTVIYRSNVEFDDDDLPVPLATITGAATSYVDNTVSDGITYFYRVGFKLGIKESVSRLIEIKAPTTPDIFSVVKLESVFPYSRRITNRTVFGDMCAVVDDWLDFKWPVAIGNNANFGSWNEAGYKTIDSIMVRLAAMVAIQKFKRDVWISESMTIVAYSTIYTVADVSEGLGFLAGGTSGIAAGSTMTWREAFNLIARSNACMDICLNVFNSLRANIVSSLTYTRGSTTAEYRTPTAVAAMLRYVCQLGGMQAPLNPFRGNGRYVDNVSAPIWFTTAEENYLSGWEPDPLAILRAIRAVIETYPEIKSAIAIWDMSVALTYSDSSAAVIDWLSAGNNNRDKCDPIQSLHIPTSVNSWYENVISVKGRGLNGIYSMYPDMYGMMGLGADQTASYGNGRNPSGFFLTTTPNGKDFATIFTNSHSAGYGIFDCGRIWNKASAHCAAYTDGLTSTDPMESQVALRYIPHLGLVDQSATGTTLTVPTGASYTLANQYSAANQSLGFPNPGLAFRGSGTTGMPTIMTNINALEWIRSGTSFTIEMFTSNLWTSGQTVSNPALSIIELGCYNSGYRYDGVVMFPYDGAFVPRRHTSHTSAESVVFNTGYFNKVILGSTEADFNAYNGSRFFNHIVLQYDAIANAFDFFCNGTIIRRWTPFTPTASLGATLSFFGIKVAPTDSATQRHYSQTGNTVMEHIIHEIVVTRAKRYNYGCFVGKVPFARKRFAA